MKEVSEKQKFAYLSFL